MANYSEVEFFVVAGPFEITYILQFDHYFPNRILRSFINRKVDATKALLDLTLRLFRNRGSIMFDNFLNIIEKIMIHLRLDLTQLDLLILLKKAVIFIRLVY